MSLPSFLRAVEAGTVLEIYVQPKSSRNEIVGVHEGSLKVRLTAPPLEGEANKECLRFLAKLLGLAKSDLQILQGLKSRRKSILISGLKPASLLERLAEKGIPFEGH